LAQEEIMRTNKSHLGATGRARRLVAGGAVVVGACSLSPAVGTGTAFANTSAVASASFTLKGPDSGKFALLPVKADECGASASAPDIQLTWYGGVKTLKGVSQKSIVTIELDLAGSKYGVPGKLTDTNSQALPFFTFGATAPTFNGTGQIWQSIAGTYSTKSKGASGNVDVELASTTGQPGHLFIKGQWKDCPVAPGT
jgi:hypothetical protein